MRISYQVRNIKEESSKKLAVTKSLLTIKNQIDIGLYSNEYKLVVSLRQYNKFVSLNDLDKGKKHTIFFTLSVS